MPGVQSSHGEDQSLSPFIQTFQAFSWKLLFKYTKSVRFFITLSGKDAGS